MFVIWIKDKAYKFKTFDKAKAKASAIFDATGVVVGITKG